MALQIVTLAERPDLRAAIFADDMQLSIWPEFMRHDPVADLYFAPGAFDRYLDFVLVGLEDSRSWRARSACPSRSASRAALELPDAGWDAVIRWAHEDHVLGRKPNAVSALEISLLPRLRGAGHSRTMLAAMKANARARGFADLYAPLRPNQKHLQPHVSMAEYVASPPDGLPADAWLRTHVRDGSRIVKVAPCSMTIVGTVADWSRWTGLTFARSGEYAIEAR